MGKTNYQLAYTSENGATVEVHPSHQDEELEENLFFAKILADKGKSVKLLPYSHEQNVKNPDAEVDGRLLDFKYPAHAKVFHTAIQSHIGRANDQEVTIVMIYLKHPKCTKQEVKRGIMAAFQNNRNRHIREVWLLYADLVLVQLKRKDILNCQFIKQLR